LRIASHYSSFPEPIIPLFQYSPRASAGMSEANKLLPSSCEGRAK
jgi:hypothetical protein